MVSRTIIGAFDGQYVLRVSKPTYNVFSTGLTVEQLAFDSRWLESGLFFMSGTITFDANPYIEVSFGTTLVKAMVLFVPKVNSTRWGGGYQEQKTFGGSNVTAMARILSETTYVRFYKPNVGTVIGGLYAITTNV